MSYHDDDNGYTQGVGAISAMTKPSSSAKAPMFGSLARRYSAARMAAKGIMQGQTRSYAKQVMAQPRVPAKVGTAKPVLPGVKVQKVTTTRPGIVLSGVKKGNQGLYASKAAKQGVFRAPNKMSPPIVRPDIISAPPERFSRKVGGSSDQIGSGIGTPTPKPTVLIHCRPGFKLVKGDCVPTQGACPPGQVPTPRGCDFRATIGVPPAPPPPPGTRTTIPRCRPGQKLVKGALGRLSCAWPTTPPIGGKPPVMTNGLRTTMPIGTPPVTPMPPVEPAPVPPAPPAPKPSLFTTRNLLLLGGAGVAAYLLFGRKP